MNGASRDRLRVGIIGLGRLWETRHKPSLLRLNQQFRIVAVHDQVARRAEIEAKQIGCAASEGLTDLIQRPDIDAIYMMSPQWFGLHPIRLAAEQGKAVYCALPLGGDLAELETLAERIRLSRIVFVPELARRCYPATTRLKELLATRLGAPRLIIGQSWSFGFDRYAVPGPTTQIAPAPLIIDPGSYLLDWCQYVFGKPPSSIWGERRTNLTSRPSAGDPAPSSLGTNSDFESFAADFGDDGSGVRISYGRYHREAWGDASKFLPPQGFQVFAERGAAWVEMPDRIQWADSSGTFEERLPIEPTVGDLLNDQFHRRFFGQDDEAPGIQDAIENALAIRDLEKSQTFGHAVAR